MRAIDRLLPAAALCAAGLVGSACAAADTGVAAEPGVDSEAAGYLADQADLLADRIADDRPCEAIEHGERLVDRTWATVSNGELATATAAHVEEVVTEIVGHLECEGPEDPEPDSDEAEGEVAQDPEPAETPDDTNELEERDEPEGDDGGPDAAQDGDSPSTSGRGADPPGQSEGRGRDNAPGQNRGGPPARRGGGR